METNQLYERIFLKDCFNKVKYVRNQWSGSEKESCKEDSIRIERVFDIGGKDYASYKFIMEQCNLHTTQAIMILVSELLNVYNSNVEILKGKDSAQRQISIIRVEAGERVLYCFKEYGISNILHRDVAIQLKKKFNVSEIRYVSLVYDNAYLEVINHNDDENDPSRGTGVYSLKWFFEEFFGVEEYNTFEKYSKKLTKCIRDYFGFLIVRTLKDSTFFNFRKMVKEHLTEYAEKHIIPELTTTQNDIVRNHFLVEGNCLVLTGTADFAQSFMTAEWLYESLHNAGHVDLTPISMGYCKSIEQFLFAFVSQHTLEKDNKIRKVFTGRALEELTDSLLLEKKEYINLGSLTGFLGYRDKDTNSLKHRNRDLLYKDIDQDTYAYLVNCLSEVGEMRNSYFHKENITEWEKVEEERKIVYRLFYIILGAYDLQNGLNYGIANTVIKDSYYNLCEYMNVKSYNEQSPMEIPVFFLTINGRESTAFFCCADDDIEYDSFGNPLYSGCLFKTIDPKGPRFKIDKTCLPERISEGRFIIGNQIPIQFSITGPEKVIFENGEFIAE